MTNKQVAKARSAADAARKASLDVKSKVATFDAIFELSRATSSLTETQRHLRNGAWSSALESYSTTREALVRFYELGSDVTVADRDRLPEMLADISSLCRQIDKIDEENIIPINKNRALSKARDYSELLERMVIQLQRSTL